MTDNIRKTFVIDTNVLIHRPDAILSFRDNDVIVPLWVLEELDKLKSSSDEKGRSARHAIRFMDEQSRKGDLSKGVKIANGIVLRVVMTEVNDASGQLLFNKIDNKIILAAAVLQKDGKNVFFVSKDINARVKAKALGIHAVDYETQKVNIDELYTGWRKITISNENLKEFKTHRKIEIQEKLTPNEFVVFSHGKDEKGNENIDGLGRIKKEQIALVSMNPRAVLGIKPLNEHQIMAMNLLLDDTIPLVTLVGKAGTGKTLLAICAGLFKVIEEKKYDKVLVSRPVVPMGKDIGYLPGDKDAKLANWMQPIFDNLDMIIGPGKKEGIRSLEWLTSNKMLEIEALTYIRGRSLPKQFLIVDEAQNLTPHEIKTIVSRAGKSTKVVLTGDPYQIDSPYLDASSNGLTYLVESFKGQALFGHVTLEHSERSVLAELAAELL
ncbi:MAG: PhoH family protein [Spirochaetales bacterium]|nr:PhoH family protein [Spirochaetales bacterium]